MLEPHERVYLSALQESPVWVGILKKLRKATPAPLYAPGGQKEFERWIYCSGKHDAMEGILRVLHGSAINLDFEDSNEQ